MNDTDEARAEMQAVIQKWDDNGDDEFGRFDNLVDALWAAGYRKVAEEVEWEYGVLFPEIRTEPSFIGVEDSARYFMHRPASSADKYATDADKRVLVRRVKAGLWEQVTP